MQDNKTFYLFVRGQKVEVSRKIYNAYIQQDEKQRKREERAKDKISITSIEGLSEKGFEIEDDSQNFVSDLIEREEQSEELTKLHAAIEQLSERDRQVIRLYYFEGKTQQEIADVLGMAKSTMSELLPRILLRLKNFL